MELTSKANRASVNVNSGKTGSGKSTSIRNTLQFNAELGQPSILAVPSKELQNEYSAKLLASSHFNVCTINHDTVDQNETVTRKFIKSLVSDKTLSITHEALKLVDHRSIDKKLYAKRDLIIDEAFNPIWMTELSVSRLSSAASAEDFISVDWEAWLNPVRTQNGFVELQPKAQKTYSTIFDIQFILMVQNPNFKVYISESNWNSLLANKADRINLFGVFDTTIFSLFRSVHIASASFHTSFLGILMDKTIDNINIVKTYEKQHEKFIFHVAASDGKLYSHSKHSIEHNFDVVRTFRSYVDGELSGRQALLLRNATDTTDVAVNYTEISNNCHGINTHRHIDAISIESTYNPNTNFRAFLTNVLGFSAEEITSSIAANTFYQCIMRTAARDTSHTTPIDVFLLDGKVLPSLLTNYFDNVEVRYVDTVTGELTTLDEPPLPLEVEQAQIEKFLLSLEAGDYTSTTLYHLYTTHTNSSIGSRTFSMLAKGIGVEKRRTRRGMVYKINGLPLTPVNHDVTITQLIDDPRSVAVTVDQKELLNHGKNQNCWQGITLSESTVERQDHQSPTSKGKLSPWQSKCYSASHRRGRVRIEAHVQRKDCSMRWKAHPCTYSKIQPIPGLNTTG